VAIPGYPILVQDYVNLPNAADSVRTFGQTHNCDVIVLMGMKVTDRVRRDSGLVSSTLKMMYCLKRLDTLAEEYM
jgi:hypothetical protein